MAPTVSSPSKDTETRHVICNFVGSAAYHIIYTKRTATKSDGELHNLQHSYSSWIRQDEWTAINGHESFGRNVLVDLLRQESGVGTPAKIFPRTFPVLPKAHSVTNVHNEVSRSDGDRPCLPSTPPQAAISGKTLSPAAKAHEDSRTFTCPGCSAKKRSFDQFLRHVQHAHGATDTNTPAPDWGAIKRSVTFPPGPNDRRRFCSIKSWSDLAELEQRSASSKDTKELMFLDYWIHNTYNPGSSCWIQGYNEVQLRSSQKAMESLVSAKEEMFQWELRTSGNLSSSPKPLFAGSLSATSLRLVTGILVCAPGQTGPQAPSSDRGNQKPSIEGSRYGRSEKRRSQAGPSDSNGKRQRVEVETSSSNSEAGNGLQFACPYWKYDPIVHARCGQWSYSNVSLVRNHLLQCHSPKVFCDRCHRHFAKAEGLCAHLNPRRCSPRKPEEAGVFGSDIRTQLEAKCNHLDAKDPGTREPRFPTAWSQWYHLWELVLKDHIVPDSPYFDESESWRPRPFMDRWYRCLEEAYQTASDRFNQTVNNNSTQYIYDSIYANNFAEDFKPFLLNAFLETISKEQNQQAAVEEENASQQSDNAGLNDSQYPSIYLVTPDTSYVDPHLLSNDSNNNNTDPSGYSSNGTYYSNSIYASNGSSKLSEHQTTQGYLCQAYLDDKPANDHDGLTEQSQSVSYIGDGCLGVSSNTSSTQNGPAVDVSQPTFEGSLDDDADRAVIPEDGSGRAWQQYESY